MRRRGRTRTTRPMGRRTNLRPKSINLPGLGIEDIDVEEIGGIGRPPLVTSTFPTRSKDDRLPETINIPNVGPIQLPNIQSGGVENPPNIFIAANEIAKNPNILEILKTFSEFPAKPAIIAGLAEGSIIFKNVSFSDKPRF